MDLIRRVERRLPARYLLEHAMPGKRPVKGGSFGGHFDELVKQFPHDKAKARPDREEDSKSSDSDASVHDRLFERAWSKARVTHASRFSNQ